MEPAGLAIGVLGLAGIFSTCLDIVEKWDSYKEFGVESKALMARFVSDRALFVEWGERTGLAKGRLENKYHRTFDRPPTREAVGKVLKSIEDIELGISNSTFTPPQIYVPNGPLAQGKSVLREDTQLNNHPGMASRMVKLKWALRNKARFIALIDSFNKLVQNLYNLVPLDQSTSAEQKVSEIEGNDSASLHATIQSILADMKKQRDDEVRSELHNWLDTYDTDRRYHDFIRRRLEGTCEWIFNRSEFLQWQSFTSENTEVLWIHAPPGYGKTILCARVIEKLLERPERPLAYSFFSSELQSRADPFVVMRSWISGIISQNREAFDLACRRWEEADRRPPSQTDIEELFNSIVRKIPGCTFIVDGLDECSVRENDKAEDRYSLLDFLKSLEHSMSAAKSRLLIISRKDQEIREGLSGSRSSLDWKVTEMQIVPEDVGLDVKLFSRSIVKKRLANKTELQRHELAQRMVDRCDSTFLAIKLLEPDLKGGKNLKQLQKIIDEAPDKLDRIYDRNWARITNLGDVERQRAFSILRWATFALRPITVSEITEVLLLADDEVEALDYTELPDSVDQVYIKTEILDLCESLVEVQGEKSDSNLGRLTIHLSHFSVRQFVLTHLPVHPEELIANAQLQSSNMAMHNNILAKTCIRYLDCESTWSVTQKSDGNSGVIQVFRDYASISWHKHVNIETDRSEDLVKLINAFFHPKNQNWQSWGKHSEHSFLDGMMSYDGDLDYANPLFYASLLGFTKTLDYLIEECGLDVNSADAANRTALLGACSRGWTAGVRHLLSKGAVVNTSSNKGVTPLHVSAMRGHVDGVKLLLEKGACLHVKDKINATPLNRAAFAGHTEVVKLLLEKGADLESQNKAGYTPLNDAASRGHVEVVKLLLGKGADLESQTNEGLRPLSYAACNGNVEVVKLLLEKGADLKLRTKAGFTPLTYAATMGHVGVW
ncbi:hypothetical protein GGS21DRAFT_115997 [Xylaria nigripes]|nr:hypothetical protein GGS21DRAFT_115997 [Xylaria nigripes]